MQPESDAKTMLCKALYEIFGVKEKPVTKKEEPIEVNAICYSGRQYGTSLGTQPQNMQHMKYEGHKHVPPPDKLMRSKECFHCHKKGHYARSCRVKHRINYDRQEVTEVCSMRSRLDTGILPMNQLTKRIQESKHANRFSTLEEENLDQEIPVPAPKLLDAKRIKELITAHKQKSIPTLADIKKVQEYVTQNAHKFDEATRKEIMELCKPKTKPNVKQLGDAHASQSKTRPTGEQMGNALKEQIQTMDEDTKIRTLNALIPDTGWNINRIKKLTEVFGLDSTFVNKSNSVQIGFALISYKRETTEISLLDTGAMENFIDAETVKRLRLGTKELPYK